MSVQAILRGILRGSTTEQNYQISPSGGMYVAAELPPLAELARKYGIVQAMTTAGVAAVVVRPSTLSLATLYNRPTSPYILVIVGAYAFNLVSTAATAFWSIWLCSHPVGMAAPAGNNISVRNWTNGKAAGDGGHTIFDTDEAVADDGWFPWGGIGQSEATGVLPSGAVQAPTEGAILVPPGAGISGQVVSSLVGDTFTFGFRWIPVPKELLPIA